MESVTRRALPLPPAPVATIFTLSVALVFTALFGSGCGGSSNGPTGGAKDFSISVSPTTLVATAGGSDQTFTVSVTGQNAFTDPVTVAVGSLPAGATMSPASPFTVATNQSQTVTVTIPASVAPGTFNLSVSGSAGALSHSAAVSLTVNAAQDFSLSVSPSTVAATAGSSSSTFTVSVVPANGFSGTVAVTISGLPAGTTTSPASPFNVSPGTDQVVTLTVASATQNGDYTLTASGNSGSLTHSDHTLLSVTGNHSVATWHYNNARTSANTGETAPTPANVNSTDFGKLATLPVDGFVAAQPLYLQAVNIPGQGTHNVVYVATLHDSVYAFDADSGSTAPLWMTSLLTYSPAGATTVPTTVTKNADDTGWSEAGIVSTPVIDELHGILYLVAETYENNVVVHRLHALDVKTGQEILNGPTTIAATYTLNGTTTTFKSLYQLNRPGLLLANGHVYLAFGSNCCNTPPSQGWVMSYNASTLQQEGVYLVEPGRMIGSIWQKGAGISADSDGNMYVETGEGFYAAGTNLSISVLKLSQSGSSVTLNDWFTPYNYQFLSNGDWDLDNAAVILPDQPGPFPHELIASGKEGTIYVLNRDNMGQLCTSCTSTDTQIIQEIPQGVTKHSGTPVYWNGRVYFTGQGSPIKGFTLSNGLLLTPAALQSVLLKGGGHAIITANGNSNGILWVVSGGSLWAFDALTLSTLYTSDQAANGRDTVPPLAHFATPIATDGKVFLGTQNSVVIYGLLSGQSSRKIVPRSTQRARLARTPDATLARR